MKAFMNLFCSVLFDFVCFCSGLLIKRESCKLKTKKSIKKVQTRVHVLKTPLLVSDTQFSLLEFISFCSAFHSSSAVHAYSNLTFQKKKMLSRFARGASSVAARFAATVRPVAIPFVRRVQSRAVMGRFAVPRAYIAAGTAFLALGSATWLYTHSSYSVIVAATATAQPSKMAAELQDLLDVDVCGSDELKENEYVPEFCREVHQEF
jgi:hypothetical protein